MRRREAGVVERFERNMDDGFRLKGRAMREVALFADPSGYPDAPSRYAGDPRVFASGDQLVEWCFREKAEGRSCPVCVLDMDLGGDVLDTALRLRAVDPMTEIVFCSSDPDEHVERLRERLHEGIHMVRKTQSREEILSFARRLAAGWDRHARRTDRSERFAAVVQCCGEAVLVLDREGNVLDCNSQALRLLGLDGAGSERGSIDRVALADLAGRRFRHGIDPFLDAFGPRGRVRNRILGVLDADGASHSWLVANATALSGDDTDGDRVVAATLHDATVVRRLHGELLALGSPAAADGAPVDSRRREIRSRILSEVVRASGSCIAVDQILSDMLLERGLDAGMRILASTLRENQGGLLRFLDDFLDHSRIEAGRLSLLRTGFDLRSLLEDVHARAVADASEKGVRTALSIGGDGSSFVLGDPGRFRQILTNLLADAVRSTESGEVVLSAELRRTGEGRTEALLAVSDTSGGRWNDQDDVFRPFGASPRDGVVPDGAGLELATARELTRLMGGRMWIEDEPGEGRVVLARFTLDRAVETFRPAFEGEATLERARVLVADTRDASREEMLRTISRFGCKAEGVGSIETLRSALRTGGPWDSVVVERSFVRDDPAGWLLALRSHLEARPPFVLLAPVGVRGEAGEAFAAGWNAYLTAPLRSRVLQNALARCRNQGESAEALHLTRHSIEESIRRGLRVLAVDRSIDGRMLAGRMFDALGLSSLVVESGSAALEAMRRTDFDVVFLESDAEGIAVAARLRSGDVGNRCGDVSLVALSPGALEGDDALLSAGFDGILHTPCTTREVAELLRKIQDSIDLGTLFDLQ